jgi:hypothetical protein
MTTAIVVSIIFLGFYYKADEFYTLCLLGLIVGTSLIFSQKTQKSWKHIPKLIIGSLFYGLIMGIFVICLPFFSYIQHPSINFHVYFWEFIFSQLHDVLIFSGISAFINLIAGLSMIVVKGLYYLIKTI